MVIRRKDGSIYKLRGPNRLLTNQEFWTNEDKLFLHNFDHLTKVVIDTPTPATKMPSKPVPGLEGMDGHFDDLKIEKLPSADEPKQEPLGKLLPQEVLAAAPENKSIFRTYNRCWLYCLPADVSTVKDRLYEQDYVRVKYKDPFRFQGAIAGSSDVRMFFWTTIDQVTPRSVVFHPGTRRWWEAQDIRPDTNNDGIVCTCVPSQVTPDFGAMTSA